jgi:hypothetical protein
MSMTDDLLGMTDAEKEAYANEEQEAYNAELLNNDEWDIDETTFKDEGEITIEDLKDSPIFKVTYGRFISASNWIRWCLL